MQPHLQLIGIDVWLPRQSQAIADNAPVADKLQTPTAAYKPQTLAGIKTSSNPQIIFIAMPSVIAELAPLEMQAKAGADAFAEPVASLTQAMLNACNWQQLLLLNQAPDFAEILAKHTPSLIMLMGLQAAQLLDKNCNNIKSLRNTTHKLHGVDCLVSYHPQAALLDARFKRPLWQDLQQAQALLAR